MALSGPQVIVLATPVFFALIALEAWVGLRRGRNTYRVADAMNSIGSDAHPVYKHPKKNWRIKQKAMPQWFKARAGVRTRTQSGAARVARFRPRSSSAPR